MSFFYAASKQAVKKPAAKQRLRDIPVASLNKLGCSACPRNKDGELRSPKMEASGARSPSIYLLGGEITHTDDARGEHWTDKAGRAVTSKFSGRVLSRELRSNAIVNCSGGAPPTQAEIECCRGRVVADIEASQPAVVVTVGDGAFQWATGFTSNAVPWRASLMPVKFGSHTCWVYPLLYPNYVHKKSYGKSEYELALEHDIRAVEQMVDAGLPAARVVASGYADGIQIITGNEAGDFNRLQQALVALALEPSVGIDFETNALRPWGKDPHVWTCAVSTEQGGVAFPVDHPAGWPTEAKRRQVWQALGSFIQSSGRKAAHNLAMEQLWSQFFLGEGAIRLTDWEDTMAMCHTFDERQGTKSLGAQTRLVFGFDVKALSSIDVKRLLEYPLKQVLLYNGMDAKWTHALHNHYMPRLRADPVMLAEYERKVRLCPALVMTEAQGVPVDFAYAQDLLTKLTADAEVLQRKVQRTPEVRQFTQRLGTFNPGSPDHVLKLMRDVLKRDEVRVEDRDGVRWTSDEDALGRIPEAEVPSAAMILELRGIEKLKGTYVEPVVAGRMTGVDRMIHSQYSSMVAVTGRLASEDPNIQNFPTRKHKEVRGMICAWDDAWLLPCDYGQLEFRVAGMASEDPEIIKACWTGYDVHGFWAQRLVEIYPECKDWIVSEFKVDWDEKGPKLLRQEMKNKWVFPQIFGASLKSCAANLHLPEDVTSQLGGEFWDTFRATKKWQDRLLAKYEKNLYVECLGGRRRRGPMSRNEIINTPIQGTGADIVTAAQVALSELSFELDRPELHPRINVHDDLTFMPPDALLEDTITVVVREMCRIRFDWVIVPLVVEVSCARRWHEKQEIGVYRSDEIFGHRNPYK